MPGTHKHVFPGVSSFLFYFHDLSKSNHSNQIMPPIIKILQNFLLILVSTSHDFIYTTCLNGLNKGVSLKFLEGNRHIRHRKKIKGYNSQNLVTYNNNQDEDNSLCLSVYKQVRNSSKKFTRPKNTFVDFPCYLL